MSLQDYVAEWLVDTFGPSMNAEAGATRFLEEAIELVQACGMTQEDVRAVAAYVYRKPVDSSPRLEAAQALITLCALAECKGFSLAAAGEEEMERLDTPEMRAKIAAKQASKRVDIESLRARAAGGAE